MRDRDVYGEDADEFRPERMMDEYFNKLPPGSFKPFGNGLRSCIGRAFTTQEATLMLAMILQNFRIELDDPEYELQFRQTLTMKPKDFKIRAYLRDGLTPNSLQRRLAGAGEPPATATEGNDANSDAVDAKPLTILYGSNAGTGKSLAQLLASHAPSHGFKAVLVESLNTMTGCLPEGHPVAIILASYEGQPTDDAKEFVPWVENTTESLKGVQYSVFGLGHHDWVSTFHRIPKLVDSQLEAAGAKRLVPLSLVDVANTDVPSYFETWEDESFWPSLRKEYGTEYNEVTATTNTSINVDLLNPRPATLDELVSEAAVVDSRLLSAAGEPAKNHIEIQLPDEMSYRAGDYLAVLPINPHETVSRVIRRFQVPRDAHVKITADEGTIFPTGESLVLADLLSSYFDLNQPASKKNIATLAAATDDAGVKQELETLSADLHATEIVAKYTSVLDLLERFPAIKLPLGSFLAMLPPMRVRQ